MEELGGRLEELLPAELDAPDAVAGLVGAGVGLGVLEGLLALLTMTFYDEGCGGPSSASAAGARG